MKTTFILSLVATSAVSFAFGPAVQSFTGGSRFISFSSSAQATPDVVGFRFTLADSRLVTNLGVWRDNDAGGLQQAHQVGIWDLSTATLVTSATVDNTGSLIGDHYYAAVSPVVLNAGTTYVIGATYWTGGLDGYISNPTTLTLDSGVTVLGSVAPATANLGFVMPTGFTAGARGRHGPNFITAPVPEPATLAVVGFGALAMIRRRKR